MFKVFTQTRICKNFTILCQLNRSLATTKSIFSKKNDKNDLNDEKIQLRRVKLYPGHQSSSEEIRQRITENNTSNSPDIFAKKVIEDFYGLNELEYEKDEEINSQDNQLNELEKKDLSLKSLIKILRNENVQEICCIQLPLEVNYADHMLIGTCLSEKHLNATFVSFNRKYKSILSSASKKAEKSIYVRNRIKLGKENTWCAVDLGRLVVHLFADAEKRAYYDLETLWTCGPDYDEGLAEFKRQREQMEARLVYLEVDEQPSESPTLSKESSSKIDNPI